MVPKNWLGALLLVLVRQKKTTQE